jgi:hypothetical protein
MLTRFAKEQGKTGNQLPRAGAGSARKVEAGVKLPNGRERIPGMGQTRPADILSLQQTIGNRATIQTFPDDYISTTPGIDSYPYVPSQPGSDEPVQNYQNPAMSPDQYGNVKMMPGSAPKTSPVEVAPGPAPAPASGPTQDEQEQNIHNPALENKDNLREMPGGSTPSVPEETGPVPDTEEMGPVGYAVPGPEEETG